MRSFKLLGTVDWLMVGSILALLVFSIAVLFGFNLAGQANIAWAQIVHAGIGLALMILLIFVDYRTWQGLGWWLLLLGIILLVSVLIWGNEVYGAQRWIDFDFFQFQPSEIVKIIFIIILARFLADRKVYTIKRLIYLLAILLTPSLLILAQPDLGTASVYLVIFFGILLVSKISRYFWLAIVMIGLIALPLVWFNLRDYQKERVRTFLYPSESSSASVYNITQSKIAIGSGGLWGRGLGQGTQSQLKFLPLAYSDFIFAGIAEGAGLLGSSFLILLEMVIVWRCIKTARLSQDEFGSYFSVGMASLFLYQIFINIGGNLGLMPITGLPLPLVSFGGTGLISYLIGLGIVQSVYLRHKRLSFG
jgi:rod shape determining protein RodA